MNTEEDGWGMKLKVFSSLVLKFWFSPQLLIFLFFFLSMGLLLAQCPDQCNLIQVLSIPNTYKFSVSFGVFPPYLLITLYGKCVIHKSRSSII